MTAHATLHGTITDTGGENCNERGFDWGYSSGSYPNSWTETDSYGVGAFEHTVIGLDLGKTVYFRAKAHNSAGWGYGGEKSFQTPSAVVTRFLVPMVRFVAVPLGRAKLTREDIVVHLRKAYKRYETQKPVRGVIV